MASPAILTKSGSILASRGARSCDICGKERARSYCAADDAYLCDRCDGSVHSANPVAGRHARVRLGPNGAPLKIDRRSSCSKKTRKKKKKKRSVSSLCKMPAQQVDFKLLTCSNSWMNRNSEALLIPQSSATSDQALSKLDDDVIAEQKIIQPLDLYSMKAEDGELAQEVPVFEPLMADIESACHEDVMQEILSPAGQEIDANNANARPFSSSIQLCEVEEEVNSTIEAGSISLDGVSEDYELHMSDLCNSSSSVEAAETSGFGIPDLNMWNDETCVGVKNPFKTKGDTLRFDQNQEIAHVTPRSHTFLAEGKAIQSTFCLRLNYEDVLSAWSDRGSLWMDGERPQTVPIDASFLEENLVHQQQVGQVPVVKALHAGAAAREARVLRYKEKRQTRLFAKKIRYEVRKLNAERRPRMKGRFVKKTHGLEDNLEGELQY